MIPQIMHSSLDGVAIQSPAIRISGEAVREGKADGAGGIALQAEVIVCSRYWMVMLVDDEMMASVVEVAVVQG